MHPWCIIILSFLKKVLTSNLYSTRGGGGVGGASPRLCYIDFMVHEAMITTMSSAMTNIRASIASCCKLSRFLAIAGNGLVREPLPATPAHHCQEEPFQPIEAHAAHTHGACNSIGNWKTYIKIKVFLHTA
jgi:hypothetical protein